ncbi:OsmC-like protein [Poriferisphaera corsica]|uniref:OsmC-like protein n=1 Tax=Poriferisphaera corsica TaxID=2528020 RepID=A0A517YW20_9BACT|nr:OsmC-related (seleno)protein [Poriferisphaera corsica]QDU34433.1 OsmC-like protein [Poriferisphaera corsica]
MSTQKTIVTPIEYMPDPETYPIKPAKKSKEGLDLEVNVIAEMVPEQGLLKRCYVQPNIPTFGAFELLCDEGLSIGGSNLAPAPLAYLAAGIAFCFLTHLKGYADYKQLKIFNIKLEQKMKFQSRIPGMTSDTGGQMEGYPNGLETNVIIDSDESPETINEMIKVSEKACMAAQTVVNAVPSTINIFQNGIQI